MTWSSRHSIRYGLVALTVITLAACGGAPAPTTAPTAAVSSTDTPAAAVTDTTAATTAPEMTATTEVTATAEMTATTEMTATAEMTATTEVTATAEMTATSEATAATTETPEVSATSAATSPVQSAVTVSVTQNATLGMILVGGNGMTLYRFTKDTPTTSACTGNCVANWPPLTVTVGTTPSAAPEVTGTLTVITRDDGSNQVVYNGLPLYFYAKDTAPGDTTGQGVGDVWYVVNITSTATMP